MNDPDRILEKVERLDRERQRLVVAAIGSPVTADLLAGMTSRAANAASLLVAAVVARSTGLSLWVWPQGDEGADPPDPTCYRWALDGEADAGGGSFYDLPSLPVHMRDHDPHTALLLALYDVPEIRARLTTG